MTDTNDEIENMINTDQEIVIHQDKFKILILAIGSAIFVGLGIFIIVYPIPKGFIAAMLSISFFGLCFLLYMYKIFDRSPGIIINSTGIYDNSSSLSIGLIEWEDVTGFSEKKMQSQRILTVHVNDPEKYLKRGGYLRRKANRANLRLAGSPIQITSNAVRIDFDELVLICEKYFSRFGNT